MEATTDKPLRSMLVIGATLEDARDFIGRDVMSRIDNVAPRKLAIPDEIWPRDETMTAEFCTPDTIPMRAFDIVVVTTSLGPSPIVVPASERVASGGWMWVEEPHGYAADAAIGVTAGAVAPDGSFSIRRAVDVTSR